MSLPPISHCASCGQQIRWVTTVRSKRMPIDPGPLEDGTVMLLPNGRVRVLTAEEKQTSSATLFRSHFASCPTLAEHRPKVTFTRQ